MACVSHFIARRLYFLLLLPQSAGLSAGWNDAPKVPIFRVLYQLYVLGGGGGEIEWGTEPPVLGRSLDAHLASKPLA